MNQIIRLGSSGRCNTCPFRGSCNVCAEGASAAGSWCSVDGGAGALPSRSPSPGIARSSASAGRWLIITASSTMQPCRLAAGRRCGLRRTRPVRSARVSSRRNSHGPARTGGLIDGLVHRVPFPLAGELDRKRVADLLRAHQRSVNLACTKSRKGLSWASFPGIGRGRRASALRCAVNGR